MLTDECCERFGVLPDVTTHPEAIGRCHSEQAGGVVGSRRSNAKLAGKLSDTSLEQELQSLIDAKANHHVAHEAAKGVSTGERHNFRDVAQVAGSHYQQSRRNRFTDPALEEVEIDQRLRLELHALHCSQELRRNVSAVICPYAKSQGKRQHPSASIDERSVFSEQHELRFAQQVDRDCALASARWKEQEDPLPPKADAECVKAVHMLTIEVLADGRKEEQVCDLVKQIFVGGLDGTLTCATVED